MPKTSLMLDSGDYAPVAHRIALFYAAFPDGRIITELVSRDNGEITFKASVFRGVNDAEPAATGWAAEREGDGEINAVACLENTETSAVGRALANLGFTASVHRPSREEMEKANRARARRADLAVLQATPRIEARATPPAAGGPNPACADAVADLMALLGDAVRAGLDAERARRIGRRIKRHRPSVASLERAERVLRRWLSIAEHEIQGL